jgi:hypothetical protein
MTARLWNEVVPPTKSPPPELFSESAYYNIIPEKTNYFNLIVISILWTIKAGANQGVDF